MDAHRAYRWVQVALKDYVNSLAAGHAQSRRCPRDCPPQVSGRANAMGVRWSGASKWGKIVVGLQLHPIKEKLIERSAKNRQLSSFILHTQTGKFWSSLLDIGIQQLIFECAQEHVRFLRHEEHLSGLRPSETFLVAARWSIWIMKGSACHKATPRI